MLRRDDENARCPELRRARWRRDDFHGFDEVGIGLKNIYIDTGKTMYSFCLYETSTNGILLYRQIRNVFTHTRTGK